MLYVYRKQRRWSSAHMQKAGFLITRLIYEYNKRVAVCESAVHAYANVRCFCTEMYPLMVWDVERLRSTGREVPFIIDDVHVISLQESILRFSVVYVI